MIPLIAFATGLVVGWWRAKRRGGDRLDRLQYSVGYGIAFALATLVVLTLAQHLISA